MLRGAEGVTAIILWTFAQPMGTAEAWMPVLYVSFGVSGFLLVAWGVHVERELQKARERFHDGNQDADHHEARLYFIEQKLNLPTPEKRHRKK